MTGRLQQYASQAAGPPGYIDLYVSEVGGCEFAFRQAPPWPGNRFVSCVHAHGEC